MDQEAIERHQTEKNEVIMLGDLKQAMGVSFQLETMIL